MTLENISQSIYTKVWGLSRIKLTTRRSTIGLPSLYFQRLVKRSFFQACAYSIRTDKHKTDLHTMGSFEKKKKTVLLWNTEVIYIRPNKKIPVFRVTRPYLNFLVKPRFLLGFLDKIIILCILKGENAFQNA